MEAKRQYIKRIIPPKIVLDLGKEIPNPAYDTPTYEMMTLAEYEGWQTREWYEQHKYATAIVVNQSGAPLYAMYKSPQADHDESTAHLFKTLRADRLNDWEHDDEL